MNPHADKQAGRTPSLEQRRGDEGQDSGDLPAFDWLEDYLAGPAPEAGAVGSQTETRRNGEKLTERLQGGSEGHSAASLGPLTTAAPAAEVPGYELLEPVGQGGMGVVYRAVQQSTGRIVAVKLLAARRSRDERLRHRFAREISAVAQLQHPNIVLAFDAGEAEGCPYLVMEFVDGVDLATLVQRFGPLSPATALPLIIQAGNALEAAHQQGFVHRDVKPGNLMVTPRPAAESPPRGTVKLLDLGLVGLLDPEGESSLTTTESVLGTVDFMAPEQAIEMGSADAQSDIYSLGCTLWYLLTASALFPKGSVAARLSAHLHAQRPRLRDHCPEASGELEAVVARMIAREPGDRFPTMNAALADLTACLEDRQPSCQTPRSRRAASKRLRLRPMATVASLGMLVAIAGLLWWNGYRTWPSLRATASLAADRDDTTLLQRSPSSSAAEQPLLDAAAGRETTSTVATPLPTRTNSIGIVLVQVPAGRGVVGSPAHELFRKTNEERIEVTIERPFWIGMTEVTQEQWTAVMQTEPWAGLPYTQRKATAAASYIDRLMADAFCRRLTEIEQAAGTLPAAARYDLPTEIEWEYACRAGSTTAYSFGDDWWDLNDYGWWGGLEGEGNATDRQYARRVAQKRPNAWGLYDMHGNVIEWCRGPYSDWLREPAESGLPLAEQRCVIRGGAWDWHFDFCRSARREPVASSYVLHQSGLRVAIVEEEP